MKDSNFYIENRAKRLNGHIGLDYEKEIKSALTKQHKITRDNIIR